MFELDSPLAIPQSKKKNFVLNLNVYRNAHYMVLNKVKVNYKAHMAEQIIPLPIFKEIQLTYTLYPKTRRLCDIGNILSIHDKFFSDALVELGKLPDDNYMYLRNIQFLMGHVDPINPRVSIIIDGT